MNNEKGTAIFKHLPEDFIVEEIQGSTISKVSDSTKAFENPKIDLRILETSQRNFLSCDLEKIDTDHFSAVSAVSKKICNNPQELGYAGTKDKKAWTCQRISIFNPDLEKIKEFSYKNIILKNFKWEKHKIKIGDLEGNRFTIVLRDADKEAIKILSKVRNTKKLQNYFGSQRFGSLRNNNVKLGKLILKNKFEEAIFAFLTDFGQEESPYLFL